MGTSYFARQCAHMDTRILDTNCEVFGHPSVKLNCSKPYQGCSVCQCVIYWWTYRRADVLLLVFCCMWLKLLMLQGN